MHLTNRLLPMRPAHHDALTILVLTESTAFCDAIRTTCPPPHALSYNPFPHPAAGGEPERLVEAARGADAVLLEWHLLRAPHIGAACLSLRGVGVPLIALCPNTETDRITALAVGADVALTPPLSAPLLQAQIAAYDRVWAYGLEGAPGAQAPGKLLPRGEHRAPHKAGEAEHARLHVGPLELNPDTHTLRVAGEWVLLTPRQSAVLACFLRHPDELLSRDRLLDEAWEVDFETSTNLVDVYVHYLRQLLARRGFSGVLRTVRGRGYCLDQAVLGRIVPAR